MPSVGGIKKNQFFGFEPIPGIQGVQHTQHGGIAGAHTVLNMLGLSPDKGLSKRDKIKILYLMVSMLAWRRIAMACCQLTSDFVTRPMPYIRM